jgi:hypothetical protein
VLDSYFRVRLKLEACESVEDIEDLVLKVGQRWMRRDMPKIFGENDGEEMEENDSLEILDGFALLE